MNKMEDLIPPDLAMPGYRLVPQYAIKRSILQSSLEKSTAFNSPSTVLSSYLLIIGGGNSMGLENNSLALIVFWMHIRALFVSNVFHFTVQYTTNCL